MKFTLIRHGRTDANDRKLSQGFLESRLVETGIKQAEYTAERLKSEHFNVAYAGDLIRSAETAKICLMHHPKVPIIRTQSLNEQCKGRYEGWTREDREIYIKQLMKNQGKDYEQFYCKFKPENGVGLANTWNDELKFYIGESLIDAQNRIVNFYKFLLKEHNKDDVLIISSGMVSGCLLSYLFNESLSKESIKKNHPKNLAITTIEANDISNPKNIIKHVYNDTSHLPDGLVKKEEMWK